MIFRTDRIKYSSILLQRHKKKYLSECLTTHNTKLLKSCNDSKNLQLHQRHSETFTNKNGKSIPLELKVRTLYVQNNKNMNQTLITKYTRIRIWHPKRFNIFVCSTLVCMYAEEHVPQSNLKIFVLLLVPLLLLMCCVAKLHHAIFCSLNLYKSLVTDPR